MNPLPPHIERVLRSHQVQPARQLFRALTHGGAEWGYPGAVDLSDVGTGKSCMDLAAGLATGRSVGVLCPPAGRDGWLKAFGLFGATPAFLESWEAVRGGFRPQIATRTAEGFRWKQDNLLLICDEAQSLRNDSSLTTFAIEGIFSKCLPCICASATLAISPLELFIAGRITGLHDGTGDDWTRFRVQHGCRYDETDGRWVFRGEHHLARIHARLIPERGCRVRKAELGERPVSTISLLPLEPPESERIRVKWNTESEKLKRLAEYGTPSYLIKNRERALRIDILQSCELAMVPLVAELARADLEEDKSVVMFFTYTQPRLKMAKLLNRYEGLYGGQSKPQRTRIIADFQADRLHVLLNNIGSGGSSVSLDDSRGGRPRVAYIFPTQRPDFAGQAPGRIDRLETKSESQQWLPVIPGTLCEWIMRSTAKKLGALSALNDGGKLDNVSSSGDGERPILKT